MNNPVYCAIDTADRSKAYALAAKLAPFVGGFKLGLEFFTSHGAEGIAEIAALGLPLFLDLKFHDIPNTVAGAMRSIVPLGVAMTTIHAAGGRAMIEAAVEAAADSSAKAGQARPAILAVTMLTSIAEQELDEIGFGLSMPDQVRRLALLAKSAGADGVIASPHEIVDLRHSCGPDFKLVIPGIRPSWADAQDQRRTLTPAEALAKGADILIIGRPITGAADPSAAAQRIVQELGMTS